MQVLQHQTTRAGCNPLTDPGISITLEEAVSTLLKELRRQNNLGVDSVYAITNINISRIEVRKPDITMETLNTLCQLYNVTLAEFFDLLEKSINTLAKQKS